jgi:hypothetical protein
MEKVFKNKRTGEIAYYKDGILIGDKCAVEIGYEPSLEFWDLVEDTFKILTVFGLNTDCIYEVVNENKLKHTGTRFVFNIDSLINELKIHSVKRLSDNQVFTVSDRVTHKNDDTIYTIVDFEARRLPESYVYVDLSDRGGWKRKVLLDNLSYFNDKIVLTTNDGADLKFGDKYFVASPKSYQIFEASAGITFKTERWKGCGFSTRELAEEWVLMNKPLLSLEDLLSAWGVEPKNVYSKSPLFYNFKKAAEKKLNK